MSTFVLNAEGKQALNEAGVESFHGLAARFPDDFTCEAPCSIKWMNVEYSLFMGAFSYAVSGFYFGVHIARYTSIGEMVQVGRQDHHTNWMSTSPFQYLNTPLFDVGTNFSGGIEFNEYRSHTLNTLPGMMPKQTRIGNDVWIGHGSFIRAGVTIGDGAIVAAQSVVVHDVPAYAVVAGNPAVVKKYRIPESLIQPLLDQQWWEFAPWQLNGISFHEVDRAVDQLKELRASGAEIFAPTVVNMKDYAAAS